MFALVFTKFNIKTGCFVLRAVLVRGAHAREK